MAKHKKQPKVTVNKVYKNRPNSKLLILNTFLLIGLYIVQFQPELSVFTKGILVIIKETFTFLSAGIG